MVEDATNQDSEKNALDLNNSVSQDKLEDGDSGSNERQLVVFKIGQEEFGVNIMEVHEIIRMEAITKIPNSADFIEGVINLRGGIIVVINLAKKLSIPAKDIDKNTRIIVIEINNTTVGMIVDSATEVLRLSEANVKPAPSIITQKINAGYIEGVGVVDERLLILLDLVKVLDSKELSEVKSQAKDVPQVEGQSAMPLSGKEQPESPERPAVSEKEAEAQ
ncbi:MAG: chemotaxis protein CheW [Candidatus Woesearchaeota archaeon]